MQLVGSDVDHVAGAELVLLVAERDPRAAVLDDDAVVVRMLLACGVPPGGHLEVAHAVGGRVDQLVLLEPVEILTRRHALPRAVPPVAVDGAHQSA